MKQKEVRQRLDKAHAIGSRGPGKTLKIKSI